jgi:hypothetical protein
MSPVELGSHLCIRVAPIQATVKDVVFRRKRANGRTEARAPQVLPICLASIDQRRLLGMSHARRHGPDV